MLLLYIIIQVNYFQGHTFGSGGNQLNKVVKVSNYYLQIYGTDSVRVFNLDQATPQTIVNGIPLLDENRSFTEQHQIVDKRYVDKVVTALGARYYAWDSASGVSDYKLTYFHTDGVARIGGVIVGGGTNTSKQVVIGSHYAFITSSGDTFYTGQKNDSLNY